MEPEDNAPQHPAPLLEADKVSKRFGGVHALKEVSLTPFAKSWRSQERMAPENRH